jgi:hypothetical protein
MVKAVADYRATGGAIIAHPPAEDNKSEEIKQNL